MKTINCFWPKTPFPGNTGDIVTPYLLKQLGVTPHWVRKGTKEKFMGSGSIARFAKEGDTLWGTGIIDSSDKIHPEANPLCVRGPKTGEKCGCEVYGDPGLLMPMYAPMRTKNSFDYMVIPHYVHRHLMHPNMVWIDPLTKDVERTCLMISTANCVISSSLHGIIIAHAYGIPAGWWRPDERLTGDDVKFQDYAESVGIDLIPSFTIEGVRTVLPDAEAIRTCQINLLTTFKKWSQR